MKLVYLLFPLLLISFTTNDDWQTKLSDELLAELQSGATVDVLIQFSDRPNLTAARNLPGKAAKTAYVFEQLKQTATAQQRDARQWLWMRGIEHRSFYLVNAIRVNRANLNLVEQLAERPEVARVMANPWQQLERMDEALRPAPTPQRGGPTEVEWNIAQINAPQVWDLGYQGSGIVIGNQDTGVDWDHEALINSYRGNYDGTADHNYNWHDAIHVANPLNGDSIPTDPTVNPCGFDSNEPCDDNGHGTYTVGIANGETADNQVGVAPAAKWIACRNMDRGWGSPASYIECFEWFLAPTDLNGENPNPAMAPHVINNSWACPEIEGCNEDNFALMEQAVDNLKAAGIVVVVSAGNSGPNCSTVSTPAAIFENSFTVGATNQQDTIANFSSRGPVVVGTDEAYRKPDIVAPGVGIRGPRRFDSYASGSGTSAAGPHVAGLVALILNANPDLIGEVDAIENIIEQTALPVESDQVCANGFDGMGIPNIVYGYGRIDALAAVNLALGMTSATDLPRLTGISVAPNPTRGAIALRSAISLEKAQLELLDVSGRSIFNQEIDLPNGGAFSPKLPALSPGVYLIRVRTEAGIWSERLVVQ